VGCECLSSQIPSNNNRMRKIKEIIKIKWGRVGKQDYEMRPGQAAQGGREEGRRRRKGKDERGHEMSGVKMPIDHGSGDGLIA